MNQFVFQATPPEQEGSRKASADQEEPVVCKAWFPPLVQPVGKKSEHNRDKSLSVSVSFFLCCLFMFVCVPQLICEGQKTTTVGVGFSPHHMDSGN